MNANKDMKVLNDDIDNVPVHVSLSFISNYILLTTITGDRCQTRTMSPTVNVNMPDMTTGGNLGTTSASNGMLIIDLNRMIVL